MHIILTDIVLPHNEFARVLDQHTRVRLFNEIGNDVGLGATGRENARARILFNLVVLDFAMRVHQHDPVLVLLDLVVFDQ